MKDVRRTTTTNTNTMSDTPPNKIWLQYHGDSDASDGALVQDINVSWCRDKIFAADEMYVRASNIMPLLENIACNIATPFQVWEWIKAFNEEPDGTTKFQWKE